PYFQRFYHQLPTIEALAACPEESLLKLWEGLGYYSRVRNMQKAAKQLLSEHQSNLPSSYEQLVKLPGIGPYTAGAIASIAFSLPVPAVDGNVLRVFSRLYEIQEDISFSATQKKVFSLVEGLISTERPGDFNQALMDLGSRVCVVGTPNCDLCPLFSFCQAYENETQESYPIKMGKAPPKTVEVVVGLFFHKNKVLIKKRTSRLLQGLWVFPLLENETDPFELFNSSFPSIQAASFTPSFHLSAEAHHIFTHRVWQMQIYVCPCPSTFLTSTSDLQQWVDLSSLHLLPMPTAMKAAKKLAETYLSTN
ncbi:MAG: A/G-specific adenine glycosylase, partial [Clostridiales bacterium]|nr:A/G-specific adenine glycosylase [Clostridiales bacterium]